MTVSVVLADANILYSRTLRDYFLYAADAGAIEIYWSQQILDEMSRNLRQKLDLSEADTTQLQLLMNDYIEYALVDVGLEELAAAEGVEMDSADRHVLAAALSVDADILLTDNTRHFPREWMTHHDIELLTAGELLVRLVKQFPDKMRVAHETSVRHSPKSETEVLVTLQAIVGKPAADTVRASSSCAPAPKGTRMTRRTREGRIRSAARNGHLQSATVSRSTPLDSELDREVSPRKPGEIRDHPSRSVVADHPEGYGSVRCDSGTELRPCPYRARPQVLSGWGVV